MHRVTWTSRHSEQPPVCWLVPDGLLRPNHVVLEALGIIGLVLVGDRGVLVTTRGRRELAPNEPETLGVHEGSLGWRPILDGPERLGHDPTSGEPEAPPDHTFQLEIAGQTHLIDSGRLLIIGRHPGCDVTLSDPRISKLHCAVAADPAGIKIVDLDSSNGTRVDGTRVHAAVVSRRVSLRLGPVTASIGPDREVAPELMRLPSKKMATVYQLVERVAAAEAPVFIDGESGSGKEGIARSLHDLSGRPGRFVAINAASLTPELAAAELFGHARGAFTSAERDRQGAFELADRGTLFLDEVGELRLDVQAELLRVIEEGLIRPLGVAEPIPVDVRLVTATHRDLAAAVSEKTFRHDLFHRIWVLPITVPALRRRPEDIDALANHFLARQRPRRDLTPEARALIHRHRWPGNVRELFNVLRRACVMREAGVLGPGDLDIKGAPGAAPTLDNVLRHNVLATYAKHNHSVAATARELGIHRATVYRHLRHARNERTRMP